MKHSIVLGAATLALFTITSTLAEETEDWSFEFAPYLFAAGMDGTAGVRGVEADVDMNFDTLLENLDSAFMARFEARRARWGIAVEGIYFKLEGDETKSWSGPLGNTNTGALDWTSSETVFQATLNYELLQGKQKLDVGLGARYTELDMGLALTVNTGLPLLPDGSRAVSRKESWIDPFIGARLRAPLSEYWYVLALADVGGFGIGTDLTYQLLAMLGWQFARQWSAEVGYRYFYQDFQEKDFEWDVTTSGPQLGIALKW